MKRDEIYRLLGYRLPGSDKKNGQSSEAQHPNGKFSRETRQRFGQYVRTDQSTPRIMASKQASQADLTKR